MSIVATLPAPPERGFTTGIRLEEPRHAFLLRYDSTIGCVFFVLVVVVVGPRACVAAGTRRPYASCACIRAYTRASMKRVSPPSCREEV